MYKLYYVRYILFFVFTPTGSSQFNDFEVQCDNTLHFTETDQTQCFNVTVYDDDICEYYSEEYFLMQIVAVEGSSAVDIDLEYGHAIVYIDDSTEPECGMQTQALFLLYTYELYSFKCW